MALVGLPGRGLLHQLPVVILADLHDEYVANGGRFYACPVCVKVRNMQDANWGENAEVAGIPSVYEYTAGGALVFNY